MNIFFFVIEISIYAMAVYLPIKKGKLSIVYIPVLTFAYNVIDPVFSAFFFYTAITALILLSIVNNVSYPKNNIFSILLFLYFLILLPRSDDLVSIRPFIFGTLWLFTFIPLISSVYKNYSRTEVFQELSNAATIILALFIINVLISSAYGFSPIEMYGISDGILYGNIYESGFNVIAIAIFIHTLKCIEHKRIYDIVILLLSLAFIMLSFRRSVMGLSIIAFFLAYLSLLNKEKIKTLLIAGSLTLIAGYTVYSTTDFADSFKERYELRKLDERELAEEKRFLEYELIFKDMFVYKDYSPLIGYELFNSWGNYGRGILEDRSLHGDLPSIAHSSGLIGVFLYMMMLFTAFITSYKAASTRQDKLIILFCTIAIVLYTITGRYTAISSMMLLFLVLMLPIARGEHDEEMNEEDSFDKFRYPFQLNEPTYTLKEQVKV